MATIAAPAVDAGMDVVRPPRAATVWAVALAGAAAAGTSLALALTNDSIGAELGEPLVIALLSDLITVSYVLCGLVAWSRRPASRFGPLLLVAGFVNFLTNLAWSSNDVAFTVGVSLDLIAPVLFLHVFLAFPSGQLGERFAQALVAGAYATAIGLQPVRLVLGGFGPQNLLELAPNLGASEWVMRTQLVAISVASLSGVGVLIVRRRRAGRPLRRSLGVLVDSFAVGLLMIAFLFLSLVFGGPWTAEIRWATFVTLALAPIALLLALLDARLARSAVGDLFVELRADPAPADLRDALARSLRDDSLELAYWLPEFETYADLDGRPVALPTGDTRRATTLIERDDDSPVAALIHDPSLREEPELLDSVAAAAAMSLENAQLHAELRARLEELKGSRARIVEAGQKERQRLERNLHDGAQQRLVALSLELSMLEGQVAADPAAKSRLEGARREIAASLEELRELARGLHPAVVSGHGLEVALEQLAARAPVPVQVTIETDGRLPEQLEVAAFYLVSESLANVGKYAQASSASVEVTRSDGRVVVEILDDGCGGADVERGSGLRGLADRVEALDGRLRVWSPVGGGTRVQAEIPCGTATGGS
jgi:signal transduction histidine kinase